MSVELNPRDSVVVALALIAHRPTLMCKRDEEGDWVFEAEPRYSPPHQYCLWQRRSSDEVRSWLYLGCVWAAQSWFRCPSDASVLWVR